MDVDLKSILSTKSNIGKMDAMTLVLISSFW